MYLALSIVSFLNDRIHKIKSETNIYQSSELELIFFLSLAISVTCF